MGMTQMNVRMDAAVKNAGDAVFEQAGYTPTQIVRMLWEYAARHRSVPPLISRIIEEDLSDSAQTRRQARLAIANEGLRLSEAFRKRLGLSDTTPTPLDYEAIREEAYFEKYQGDSHG